MDNRYRLFKEARTPNIASYNAKVDAANILPTYWVIHDEFAEWMPTEEYRNAVTSTVGRLGFNARAAGIHLIFAAQRTGAALRRAELGRHRASYGPLSVVHPVGRQPAGISRA